MIFQKCVSRVIRAGRRQFAHCRRSVPEVPAHAWTNREAPGARDLGSVVGAQAARDGDDDVHSPPRSTKRASTSGWAAAGWPPVVNIRGHSPRHEDVEADPDRAPGEAPVEVRGASSGDGAQSSSRVHVDGPIVAKTPSAQTHVNPRPMRAGSRYRRRPVDLFARMNEVGSRAHEPGYRRGDLRAAATSSKA